MTHNLESRIHALDPWFHNLVLDGIPTAPHHSLGDYPRQKYAQFAPALPPVAGRSVLDIGCNAGFYAFEMKQRGASRVVGIDTDPRYLAQARLAAGVLGCDVDFRDLDAYCVGDLGERFDLVIFMGVLCHMRHPLLALECIEQVCGGHMLLQSMLPARDTEAMLRSAGFVIEQRLEDEVYTCRRR